MQADSIESIPSLFAQSAQTEENRYISTDQIEIWLNQRRSDHHQVVEEIPFADLKEWSFEESTGTLVHSSGRFFSIEGISVETNYGHKQRWSQPIINQPEIGLLCILVRRIAGVLYFLMQAKMEPGNVNGIQLAPTIQATRSNLMCVHRGRQPFYMDYMSDSKRSRILIDVLQSEQGARFLAKRNRNMIVEVLEDDIPLQDGFCWLTLRQIHCMMSRDNVVNMDARTVLGSIPYASAHDETWDPFPVTKTEGAGTPSLVDQLGKPTASDAGLSLFDKGRSLHTMEEILSWFTKLKFYYELNVSRVPLKNIEGWIRTPLSICHETGKYFSVIALRVKGGGREVEEWTQPIVRPRGEGIAAFIMRRIEGILHILVQAKVEPGNFDILEMAPTVQCLTGNYRDVHPNDWPPFLDYVLGGDRKRIRLSTRQSEEGGRFFQESNLNLWIEAEASFPIEVPENYIWMTPDQLKTLILFNNYVNVQARCLVASLGFI